MKKILALIILLSSVSAFAAEKTVSCTKRSNAAHGLQLVFETQTLQVKRVILTSPSLDGAEVEPTVLRPIGQVPWQNFAFLVSLPMGRTLIAPFSVFTQASPTSEVILDGSIQYKCK